VAAEGSPFDIGFSVGSQCKTRIRTMLARRREWFDDLKTFALADRAARLDGFVAAVHARHPDVLAELQGMAKGAELALEDILVLNLQTELGAMKSEQRACDDCSTLYLAHEGRILLAHNEDGDDANRDLMAVLQLRPVGLPAITAFAYPGILPGCVPAMTSAGLVMTTNYIGATEVALGVPRYMLGRAVLSAKSLDQAVAAATGKHAAYSFHLNLGSREEQRAVVVDVAVNRHAVMAVEGLFLQTNHFVLEQTRQIPQPWNTPGSSSDSRYRTLKAALGKLPALSEVTANHLVRLLSSHEAVRAPYSPCRHPSGDVHGRTLGTAVFDVIAGSFELYEGNPCAGRKRRIAA
jgi:isopenicillin-N N-acyltransferase-like protein